MSIFLKLAWRPFRLAPLSQASSILTASVLLVLSGFLFWIEQGFAPVVQRLQQEQVITAYLSPQLDRAGETRLVDSIQTSLGSAIHVQKMSASEFIAELKPRYPELSRELEDMGEEGTALIPRYISISGVFQDQTAQAIHGMPGIESMETSKDRYKNVVGAFRALRWVARLMLMGLALALMTGLVHLVRMNRTIQSDAISFLRLWGANEVVIRMPTLISSWLVGFMGGAIAWAAWATVGVQITMQVKGLSPLLTEMPVPSASMGLLLLVIGSTLGMISGVLAAGVSSR